MKNLLLALYLISGIITAILWFKSATVKEKISNDPDSTGFVPASIGINGNDLGKTFVEQSKWNSRAAFASVITAILQVVTTIFK